MKRRQRISILLVLLIVMTSLVACSPKSSMNSKGQEVKKEVLEDDVRKIKILAGGDLMYHMPVVRAAYEGDGSYNFDNQFKHINTRVKEADLAIVNFETAAAGKDYNYTGYPMFNTPQESLDAIQKAGFNLISMANNHMLDRGFQGALKTKEYMNSIGLNNMGLEEEYIIEEIDGVKLGLMSFTYGFNGNEMALKEEEKPVVNTIEEERLKKNIEELRDQVDFIILYLHWGIEYQNAPNEEQVDLANKIFDWGGDIILGSHPHVLQRAEKKELAGRDRYVIYSMGNFLSNQRIETVGDPYTEDGIMVELELSKDMNTGKTGIDNVEHIPTWSYKYETHKPNFEIVPIEDALNGKINLYNYGAVENRLRNSLERTNRVVLGIEE